MLRLFSSIKFSLSLAPKCWSGLAILIMLDFFLLSLPECSSVLRTVKKSIGDASICVQNFFVRRLLIGQSINMSSRVFSSTLLGIPCLHWFDCVYFCFLLLFSLYRCIDSRFRCFPLCNLPLLPRFVHQFYHETSLSALFQLSLFSAFLVFSLFQCFVDSDNCFVDGFYLAFFSSLPFLPWWQRMRHLSHRLIRLNYPGVQ